MNPRHDFEKNRLIINFHQQTFYVSVKSEEESLREEQCIPEITNKLAQLFAQGQDPYSFFSAISNAIGCEAFSSPFPLDDETNSAIDQLRLVAAHLDSMILNYPFQPITLPASSTTIHAASSPRQPFGDKGVVKETRINDLQFPKETHKVEKSEIDASSEGMSIILAPTEELSKENALQKHIPDYKEPSITEGWEVCSQLEYPSISEAASSRCSKADSRSRSVLSDDHCSEVGSEFERVYRSSLSNWSSRASSRVRSGSSGSPDSRMQDTRSILSVSSADERKSNRGRSPASRSEFSVACGHWSIYKPRQPSPAGLERQQNNQRACSSLSIKL